MRTIGRYFAIRLLLDTHIWWWTLTEPSRVGMQAHEAMANSANELWLSPISTWEILVLSRKGRIRLHQDPAVWLARAKADFHEAPLTHDIALAAHTLAFAHRDPADCFLAATAKVLDLTLVTADERLLGLGDIRTLANR